MKSIIIILSICLLSLKGYSLADPYSTSVYGYTYSTRVNTTQFIQFNVGNGNSADRVILANSVEWTLNFPTTILTVGVGYTLPAPFYEYGRTSDATSTSILIRTNANIDYLANSGNPLAQAFTLNVPVTGTVAGTQGTISINNRVLPGFNGTVGNGNTNNDNATSPIIFSASPLPVSGLQLKGKAVTDGNLLSWYTLNEQNTHYFSIQKSTNGQKFVVIGQVAASDNSNIQQHYSFTDREQSQSIVYYKVVLVDKSSRRTTSNTVAIEHGLLGSIKIFPIPATQHVIVNGTADNDEIRLLDATGKVLQQLPTSGALTQINIATYPAGTYMIQVYQDGNLQVVKRFVKQ